VSDTQLVESCERPELSTQITPYCFGDISKQERSMFEAHVLECDSCWREVDRLSNGVHVLRTDSNLKQTLVTPELFGAFGISGGLDRPFGGHLTYVIAVAVLYGLEWTAGIWTELGYSYDRFGPLAWMLSGPVMIWVSATLVLSLRADANETRAQSSSGLVRSGFLMLVSLAVLTIVMTILLPSDKTILASIQTRSANGGYLKDAVFLFLPLLVFVLPPFHSVLALQRELRAGRSDQVMKIVTRASDAIAPRGVWFLSPRLLAVVLFVVGAFKIVGTNYMLDSLAPGPYANLFTFASYTSTALWFGIALLSLVWYSSRLNELKREAIALQQFLTRR
jgi:hypothetical protein